MQDQKRHRKLRNGGYLPRVAKKCSREALASRAVCKIRYHTVRSESRPSCRAERRTRMLQSRLVGLIESAPVLLATNVCFAPLELWSLRRSNASAALFFSSLSSVARDGCFHRLGTLRLYFFVEQLTRLPSFCRPLVLVDALCSRAYDRPEPSDGQFFF